MHFSQFTAAGGAVFFVTSFHSTFTLGEEESQRHNPLHTLRDIGTLDDGMYACPSADGIVWTAPNNEMFQIACSKEALNDDIHSKNTSNLPECLRWCADTRGCAGVSYTPTYDRSCHLKGSIGGLNEAEYTQTGVYLGTLTRSSAAPNSSTVEDVIKRSNEISRQSANVEFCGGKPDGEILHVDGFVYRTHCGSNIDIAKGIQSESRIKIAEYSGCLATCSQRSDCVAVTFDSINTHCYRWASASGLVPVSTPGYMATYKEKPETPAELPDSNLAPEHTPCDGNVDGDYLQVEGYEYKTNCGQNVKTSKAVSGNSISKASKYDRCLSLCSSSKECNAVTYDSANRLCFLWASANGLVTAPMSEYITSFKEQ